MPRVIVLPGPGSSLPLIALSKQGGMGGRLGLLKGCGSGGGGVAASGCPEVGTGGGCGFGSAVGLFAGFNTHEGQLGI